MLNISIGKNLKYFEFLDNKVSKKLTTKSQDSLIKDVNNYVDKILVSTPDLLDIVPNATYYPVVMNEKFFEILENNNSSSKEDDIITILHAPSNVRMKGTAIVSQV